MPVETKPSTTVESTPAIAYGVSTTPYYCDFCNDRWLTGQNCTPLCPSQIKECPRNLG